MDLFFVRVFLTSASKKALKYKFIMRFLKKAYLFLPKLKRAQISRFSELLKDSCLLKP